MPKVPKIKVFCLLYIYNRLNFRCWRDSETLAQTWIAADSR
jgi:hypothetical protein